VAAASAAAWAALVAPAAAGEKPIQDNSFLIEEAYNQEPGVIQHISAFSRAQWTGAWQYTFTEEWPIGGQEHQGSVTLPLQRLGTGHPSGLGDVLLNYRWQALGDGEAPVACAPRLSLLLPTGDSDHGRGFGGTGLQVNLPISAMLGRQLVTHVNAGLTWVPAGRIEGASAAVAGWSLGQSLIWLASQPVNLMVEAVYAETEIRAGGSTSRAASFTLNPGLRGALDLPGDVQAVAGLAVPIGIGPSHGERGLFLYLSFEHPFALAGSGR
jgi:hypothetical protein